MLKRLLWLSLGMFAIGTEGFAIAGVLPVICSELGVSVAGGGQLVTVFALVYAISSPITATLTAGLDRRRVLLVSLAGFMLSNLIAAAATGFAVLVAARVLLALSAGLYSPSAAAFAGTFVAPELRGRALAVVVGGVSAAVAIGAPLGTVVGTLLGWRYTFVAVAVISAAALVGIGLRLPHQPAGPGVSLRERLRTAGQRDVFLALLATFFWGMGGFAIYTYTAPLLQSIAHWQGALVSVVLLAFGVGAVSGTALGGVLADRLPPGPVQAGLLAVLALISTGVAVTPLLVAPSLTAALMVTGIFTAWGLAGWAFHPAQQVRLMGMAPRAVPIVLSLNQSAMYLGIAAGGIAGGITLRLAAPGNVGWVAAACQLAALAALTLGMRAPHRATAAAEAECPLPAVAAEPTAVL